MILQLADGSLATSAATVVGMAALAAAMAAAIAVGYRWYTGERVQEGLAVLVGLAAVAIYLNTTTAIGQVIGPERGAGLFDPEAALVNVGTFLLAGGGSFAGRRVGDRLAVEASFVTGRRALETDVSRLVSAVGRVVTVTVPDEIGDIEGYDPVSEETKASLAGKTLLFPRGLTVAELRDRLRTRLADDYGVGHVDVELAADGSVEYLAVGSRAAGLGPTLAPDRAATAVRADPAYAASQGDAIELWLAGGDPERVVAGELRAAAGDVVTVVLPAAEARALDPDRRYRLVTRPVAVRPELEFASVLRVATETMGAVTVSSGSALVGTPISALDLTVVAVQPADGGLEAVPPRTRPLAAGDVVYAVARPEALRRLEAAAGSPESEPSS